MAGTLEQLTYSEITMRSSFPGYFQDENGNFIYGFMEDETGEEYDCQVICCYLTETLGGRVGAGYENPYGEGRIVFVSPEG